MSGRIVVALQGEGIQLVDNFVAHTKISVQNIKTIPVTQSNVLSIL
jgi:hypothetical protein